MDLDGTITQDFDDREYYEKLVDPEILEAMTGAQQLDYEIEIFTARGMRSHDEDLKAIEDTHRENLQQWLSDKSVPYKRLEFGKLYCGKNGFYVDDKALYNEDFVSKFTGTFSKLEIDIICPFYNEGTNVCKTHQINTRAERIFKVKNYIYVNNGSTDATQSVLQTLAAKNDKIVLIHLTANNGYGSGLKSGLKKCTASHAVITHGDGQFDIYDTYRNLSSQANQFDVANVIPRRVGRSKIERAQTHLVRLILSIALFKRLPDFNGQPKLLELKTLGEISTLPDDFTIDLEMCLRVKQPYSEVYAYVSDRNSGKSKWNSGWNARAHLFSKYIKHALMRLF